MKKKSLVYILRIVSCFLFFNNITAQTDSIKGVALINKFLLDDEIDKADSTLNSQLNYFKTKKLIDSLTDYPYYIGKLSQLKFGSIKGINDAENLVKYIEDRSSKSNTLYKVYKNISDFYDALGKNQEAYGASKKALNYALQVKNIKPEQIGLVRYGMAFSAYSLNNYSEAKNLFLKATKEYESSQSTSKEALADAYNASAALMWHFNKLDSAQYYFEKAIKATNEGSSGKYNKLYLSSVYNVNIALLEESKGNISKSISIQKQLIQDFNIVINYIDDDMLKERAKRSQTFAISNLGATYSDLGNITKAYKLQKLALSKKKEVFEASDIRISNTLLNIAKTEFILKDYDGSIITCNEILKQITSLSGEYFAVKANALLIKAQNYIAKKDIKNADSAYMLCSEIFKNEKNTEYTQEHLIYLRDYSFFLATQNKPETAIKLAKKGYNYVVKNGGENNINSIKHILNVQAVFYELKNYKASIEWAEKGFSFIEYVLKNKDASKDILQLEFYNSLIKLTQLKSKYNLHKNNDEVTLIEISDELEDLINVYEKRKTTVFTNTDISKLLIDYKEVNDFSKKIQLELYYNNQREGHLNKAITMHESSIYFKIRSRLNLKRNFSFKNMPSDILEQEKKLQNELSSSLKKTENINDVFKVEKQWEDFLDTLKTAYPKYHKMRYASINSSLENIQQRIPDNTTVIRYFFTGNDLNAYLLNRDIKKLFKLDETALKKIISDLNKNKYNLENTAEFLHQLYQKLWKPFANDITTKNITIIPDGNLYNLSFETLTPTKIKSFKDLATNSLLAKYNISYNYSLYLLEQNKKATNFKNSFIAFAPEFNDKMKESYKLAITDSINLDKTYLTLLQQPFNVHLAKAYANLCDSNYFLNENSTEHVFKQNASEHKIIHIGTHAESNNISPELSRLLFAKNISDKNEDGSLYAYEIYDTSLNSNLAILTACETGKPSYQAGEGMISLAHAFNYAGSESILTSLWKVDERSTSEIIESFYKNINAGKPKDEALRLAKLDYINNTEGRTVSPKFWAGLVLMGDASPIEISNGIPLWQWLLIIGCVLLGIFFIIRHKKR